MLSCLSCGHENNGGSWCQACGAALATDDLVEDGALSLMLGLVCEACDSYNEPGAAQCIVCGVGLGLDAAPSPAPAPVAPAITPAARSPTAPSAPAWMMAPEGQPLATANALPAVDLAVLTQQGAGLAAPAEPQAAPPLARPAPRRCPSCDAAQAPDDRFCARCGSRLDAAAAPAPAPAPAQPPPAPPPHAPAAGAPARTQVMARAAAPAPSPAQGGATMMMPSLDVGASSAPSATMFFGAASVERFARLILVKGHTQFGSQWRLQGDQTVIGRSQGLVLFPEDPYLAPRHCRLEMRGDDLWLVAEPTANGVFIKINGKAPVFPGDEIVVGVQRLRVLSTNDRAQVLPPRDGDTRLLGSLIRRDEPLMLERMSANEALREVYVRPQRLLSLGRAQCDVSFPEDPYLSTRHAQLVRTDAGVVLEDLQSRNGTFLRVKSERKLEHGDAIMLGEQVLRVELSAKL